MLGLDIYGGRKLIENQHGSKDTIPVGFGAFLLSFFSKILNLMSHAVVTPLLPLAMLLSCQDDVLSKNLPAPHPTAGNLAINCRFPVFLGATSSYTYPLIAAFVPTSNLDWKTISDQS